MNALTTLSVSEARLLLRDRFPVLISLGFPLLIVVIFGSIAGSGGPTDFYSAMGVAMVLGALGLNLMPAYLALYREKGILRRLSTTPVHPAALLFAQVAVNACLAVAGAVLVLVVGKTAFGFALPSSVPVVLLGFVLGLLSLFSVGLFVAALAPTGKAANGIGMVLWIASLFFGGVFVPVEAMPKILARIGDFTPLGAALATLRDGWAGHAPSLTHLLVMAGYTVVFGTAAGRLFRWE